MWAVLLWLLAAIACCTTKPVHALRPATFSSLAFTTADALASVRNRNNVATRALTRLNSLSLSPLTQDICASALSVTGTIVWLQIWITLAKKNIIEPNLSRKIIHTGSAPLFMCLWPLYSATPQAKYFAAGVVLLQMTRLLLAGTLKSTKELEQSSAGASMLASSSTELVNAISRTGAKKEALGGPLVYTMILLLCTAVFFRESPAGIVAIIQMAAGDGMADIVGRRFGKNNKWFLNESKSYVGSAAFVVSAFTVTCAIMALYHATGFLGVDVVTQWPTVLLISVLCALVEVLPLGEDNVSVPIAGAVLAAWLL